jgi:hypothetical protein
MTTAGELLEERAGHRRTLVRMALMYTPFAIIGVALVSISLWSLFQGNISAIVPVIILGMIALALVFQALSALRDLRSEPTITTGEVRRTWTKGTILWFFRSHYVLIGRNVFDVSPVTHMQVQEGDFLEIKHWPHTKGVITVHRLREGRMDMQQPEPSGATPAGRR